MSGLSQSPPVLLSPNQHKEASSFHKESPKMCASKLAEINFCDTTREGS